MRNLFVGVIFVFVNLGFCFSQSVENEYCGNAEKIKAFFQKQGFDGLPIKIIGSSEEKNDTVVRNFANLKFEIEDSIEDIYDSVLRNIKIPMEEGFYAKGIITKNENFCDKSLFNLILNNYNKDKYDVSIITHIWDNPKEDEMDILFAKFNLLDLNKRK